MNQEQKLLGYYNYTVILTYIGMVIGFFGIVYSFERNAIAAVICLMIAGLCDMFDGTIASTRMRTDQEKCFGIQIDSLSDLICFGVLPASLVYSLNNGSDWTLAISGFYVLSSLIRLAYFNVDEQERQKTSLSSRQIYYGLPVTLSALFIPLAFAVMSIIGIRSNAPLVILLAGMAIMFLVPVPLKKPNIVGKICAVLVGVLEIGLVLFACFDV